MEVLREKLKQLIQSRKYHKLWMSMISVMAGIVVFVTTYALILPAITLERKAAEEMAGFDASAEGTDILPESSVLMDGDLMPADGFLTDDILGDQAFSIQEEMEEDGFEDGTVYDGETVLEDGFLIEEEPYTEEELLMVEDGFTADEGNLVNEVLPEDGILSGGILSGAWDLPEDGILRREEDLPEEETLREEELLPEEETLREEELLPEEETLREEELLPEEGFLREEELLPEEELLQNEETLVAEELLPKDSQVSKGLEESEPADTYIILPGKEMDQTEEELPEEEAETEAGNERPVKVIHKAPALRVPDDEDGVRESLQASNVQTISDLNQIATVTGVSGAVQNSDGSYTVVAGEQYQINIHFEETADLQVNMDGSVTYSMPTGFNPAGMNSSGTIELDVTGGQKAKASYQISGNIITFTWDKNDPNYDKLASSGYLNFDFELKGTFTETTEDLKFTDTTDGTVKVTNDGSLRIGKSGWYNAKTNQMEYTVTVTGTGINTNVNIQDAIVSSGILTFDSTKDLDVTSSTGNTVSYTGGKSGNGFDITIGKVGNGETVTVKYYADVDLSAYKDLSGEEAKAAATKNEVQATSDHQTTPVKDDHSEPYINVSEISKSVVEKGTMDENGKQKITWRIEANQSANLPMGGQTITDAIAADSQAYLKYSGSGIRVYRINKDGDYVGGAVEVSWNDPSIKKTDTSWTWTVPDEDTTPYYYLIEYETIADASSLTNNKTLTNHVEGGYGSSGGGQTVIGPVGGTADVTKRHTNVDLVNKEVTWEVVINVPKAGLSSCSLRESLPYLWNDNQQEAIYADTLKSIDVISGLVEGESWSYQKLPPDGKRTYYDITFQKIDEDGQEVDGLYAGSSSRKIRVQIVTKLDDAWLEYASQHNMTEYGVDLHNNVVILYADGEQKQAQDTVKIDTSKPSLAKTHDEEIITSDSGKETVMVKYYVALTGVKQGTQFPITLTDSFNSKYFSFQDTTDTNYNQSNGYVFGTNLDTPKPSYNEGAGNRSANRVVAETAPGTLTITINGSDLPKNDGKYYPLYVVEYYLKVKDDATLLRLKNDAIQQDGGKLAFVNNVTSKDFGDATDTVEYEVPILTKDLQNEIQLDQNTGTFRGTFKIDVNKDGKMIGDEGTLTLKDTTTNLSIVYDSIAVWEVGDNDTLTKCTTATWNREGYDVVYSLPNQKHLRITYDVIVTGSGNVHWVNTAELNGQKVTKSGDKDLSGSGSGSAYTYGITILKHDKDDLTKTLPGATFAVYRWKGSQSVTSETILASSDLTKDVNANKWAHIKDITTGEGGTFNLNSENDSSDGYLRRDTWYMLVETKAPANYDTISYNPVFKITKDGNADYNNFIYVNGDTLAIRDSQTPPNTATIKVTKTWAGENGDTSLRKPVTVHLLADGAKPTGDAYASFATDITLSDNNNWTYTWTDLPGGPTYSVKEDAVPGYVTSYQPAKGIVQGGEITITNTKRPNKTAIHVEKEWSGSHVNIGDVTMQVKRYVTPNAFVNIYGQNKRVFVSAESYAVGDKIALQFNASANGFISGYTITNAATGDQLLKATKIDNQQYANELHTSDSVTLPKEGIVIVFDDVDGDSFNEQWAFGEQKPTIIVTEKASSSEPVEDTVYTLENHTVTLNADNNWQADIDNLPLSDEDGSYTYYVEETGMNDGTKTPEEFGYTVTYDNNAGITKGTIRVTNSKEDPNKTTITLNKNWSGNNHGGNTEVRYEVYRTTTQPKYHTVTLKYPEEVNNDAGHTDISQTRTKTYQVLDGSNVELFVTHAWWDPYPSELYDVKVNGAVQHFDAQHSSSREITLYSWVKYEEHIFTIDNITADTTIELDYKNLNAEEFMEPVLEERPQISLGTPYKTGTISGGGNNWTTTIKDLDKTDENGNPYYYFIYETDLDMDDTTDLTRFDTSYSHQYVDATSDDREVTITNTIRPEYTWLQVHKVWENVETIPASVDVVLYRRRKTETGKPHWYDQIKIVPNGLKEAVDATKWNQDLHETWSAGWYALSPDYDYFIAETNVDGEWYSNASYFINYTDAGGRPITPESYEGDNNRYYPVQTGAVSGYHHATITNSNTQVNFEKKWAGATDGKFIIDGVEYEAKDLIIEVQLKQYINGSATAANPMKASDQYNASQTMTLDGVADENQTGKYYENEPWHFVWKGLPAIGMDASGSREDYTYKVEETGIYLKGADGKKTGDNLLETGIFTQKTSADGRTITNTIKKVDIPTTDVTVNKSWLNKDASTDWPTGAEVEMTLYRVEKNANEEETLVKVAGTSITNPVTLTAEEGEQSYTWTDLPKTLSDGTTGIKYVVKETAVTGYTSYATTAEGSEKSDTAEALLSASSGAEEEDAETMLTASFLNRENEGGKVSIQITKNITDASGNPIELVADVANKFAVLTSTTDTDPNHVIDVNKNEYKGEYPNIGSYTNKVADAEITVSYEGNTADSSQSATTGSVYVDDLEGGMYTITEDPKSIPDKIYDKDGNVYQYKETKLESEYAWRENGDEGARHWSKTYTKADDKLIATPEAAGAYGDGLYNGYLDFYVTNVYEKVDETVTTEILNLELDKAWDRGGDATPPASGSVTFELHQVETTVTTTTGGSEGDNGNSGSDSTNTGSITINLFAGNGTSLISTITANPGDEITLNFELNNDQYIGVYLLGKYNAGEWGYEGQIYKNGSATGTYSYTIPENASNSINFKFADGITIGAFKGTPLFNSDSVSDPGSSSNVSTDVQEDPDGSGFPKTITLTADDKSGNLWKHVEEGLLSKVTSASGDTTTTKTYTYYVVETGRTGLASAYSETSIAGKGSQSNPISGADGSDHKVMINAKNTVPKPDDKFITVKKTWLDEDGNPLLNHPNEVKVDVWRVKLPSALGGSGGVSFVYTDLDKVFKDATSPGNPSGNGSTVEGDVVFQYNGNTFYVEAGYTNRTFSASQLEEMKRGLDGNGSTGDFIIKLSGKVWNIEDFYEDGIIDDNHNKALTVHNGDLLRYDGKLYVYKISSNFDGSGTDHGIIKEPSKWHLVGEKNVITTIDIELPDNKLLLNEETIKTTYLKELYDAVDKALNDNNTGITWTSTDKELKRYEIGGVPVTLTITDDDDWQTSFTADSGYLYFFFEHPLPGYTTLYRDQEHGVFDQDMAVEIVNQTPAGQLDVTKEWTGDEVTGDQVFVKIFRDGVDITDDIAADAASYGLSSGEDRFFLRNGHKFLIIKKTGNTWETVQIKDLPIAEYSVNAKAYEYSVQEVGYHDTVEGHTGYYWSASDVLTGYSTMVYTRSESTDTDGKKTVSYTEGTATVSTGAASEGVTVGSVNVVPAAEEGKDPTITFTSGKSLVTVKNASEATLDLTVQKRWQSNHTTWNPDYGQNLSIYFKLYKVKGEAREQVNHTIYQLTKDTKVDVAESDLGSDAALVKAKFTQNTDSTYSIPFMITIPDLPVLKDGWEYAVVECNASGTEFEQGENKTFWTCLEFNNTTTAIKNDLTDVSATKSWDDQSITGASHPAVTFSLYRTTDTIQDNGWSNETGYDHLEDINWGSPVATAAIAAGATGDALIAKWTDLPKYDITTGKLYTYYVQESAVDGYTLKSRGLAGGNKYQFTFENKLDDKTTFEFSKIWKDISSNPTTWPGDATITVTLNAYTSDKPNSKAITDVVVTLSKIGTSDVTPAWTATTSDDGKKTTFKVGGLAKYSSDGKELTYYVVESQVDGYKAPSYGFVSDDGVLRIPQDHGNKAENGEVVVNTPEGGYELPSTGGPGTRLFTILGSILITGAGILLVRRRRRTI